MSASLRQPLMAGKELPPPSLANGSSVEASAPSATDAVRYTQLSVAPAADPRPGSSVLSPIDYGFERHEEFDRGEVDMRPGQGQIDNITDLQQPLGGGAKFLGCLAVGLLSVSVIGLPYVLAKWILVRRGEIAIVEWRNGNVRVLSQGWHIIETLGCRVRRAKVTDNVIQQGSLSIIRVLPGQYGLGLLNGHPLVLLPGRHLINDPLFSFTGSVAMTEAHITVSTTHLLTVAVGKVGLCMVNTTAHFLEPGMHRINSPRFEFLGFRDSTDEHIRVGSKHRIVVPSGKVGLGWENGSPLLLETGKTYNIDSPTFSYAGSQALNAAVIKHGSVNIVTVKQGQAGISYDQGVLNVLPTGRHMLTGATQLFAGFLGLGQQVLKIEQVVSMTSDNVGIKFDAAVSIQVVDPMKAVTMLCPVQDDSRVPFSVAQMHATIVEKAKLGLSIIIGNNRLNATFKATQRLRPSNRRGPFSSDDLLDTQSEMLPPHVTGASAGAAGGTAGGDVGDPEAEGGGSHDSFKQHVHDVFMHSFSEQMINDCGIHVQEMSIEDVSITNAELAHAMAQGAVARTGLIKAQIDLEILKTQAFAEQAAEVLRAQGHAQAIGILASADADRISKLDEAMSRVCATTQQRELVRASGEVLKDAKATVLLAHSAVDVSTLLSGPASSSILTAGSRVA